MKNNMKKQYIKPAEKERMLTSAPLMLTISQGENEEELVGSSNGRRGQWGDLWGDGEE